VDHLGMRKLQKLAEKNGFEKEFLEFFYEILIECIKYGINRESILKHAEAAYEFAEKRAKK